MRLHLFTTASRAILPFNYQQRLTGAIHKWLGADNDIHGKTMPFSFSMLNGANAVAHKGLQFPNGANWFISSYDESIIKQLILGIQHNPVITEDLFVREITVQEDPVFGNARIFRVGSPVLVKQKHEKGTHHFTFSEREADQILTERLKIRLKKAGLSDEGVQVEFQRYFPGAKTKVIQYDGIGNRVNFCPVAISGTPEQLAFAWNVGVGHSNGIGFGSLI